MNETFKIIQSELDHKGKSKAWLADLLGESTQNINNWKKRAVPAAKLRQIAEALDVTTDYLEGLTKVRKPEDINIPIYDQNFGMGGHIVDVNQDVLITQFATNKKWIRENLKGATNSKNVCIITGQGGSMGETIKDGSAVFIDVGVSSFAGDNIYALKTTDESLMIKRVAKLSNGSYLLISDGEHYPNEECDSIKIIGRVLGAMNFNQL